MSDNLKEYSRNDQRYNSTNSSLYFRTKSVKELKPFADLFLDEQGKKIIPLNIALWGWRSPALIILHQEV